MRTRKQGQVESGEWTSKHTPRTPDLRPYDSLIPSLALVLVLSSCSDAIVHSETRPVPGSVWDRSWKPEYSFEITDTISQYDTYLDVRHTGSYAYSELYLFVTLKRPDGHVYIDTVQCPLSDANGKWYGKGLGFIRSERFDAHILYKYGNRFPQRGRYSVTLEQAMREEKLENVIDVGVSVEKHLTK
ncbi:MAG: gliding motility lipoprotein GldH [Flavobacteriales bacterium]|nr:gliding motility lipoprotein GldH [Flavobacteriales bacterium]